MPRQQCLAGHGDDHPGPDGAARHPRRDGYRATSIRVGIRSLRWPRARHREERGASAMGEFTLPPVPSRPAPAPLCVGRAARPGWPRGRPGVTDLLVSCRRLPPATPLIMIDALVLGRCWSSAAGGGYAKIRVRTGTRAALLTGSITRMARRSRGRRWQPRGGHLRRQSQPHRVWPSTLIVAWRAWRSSARRRSAT